MRRFVRCFLLFVLFSTLISCSESDVNSNNAGVDVGKVQKDLSYNDIANGACLVSSWSESAGYVPKALKPGEGYRKIDKVIYYIEKDTVPISGVDDFHDIFVNSVVEAAEIWNSESVAPPLVYGGEVTYSDFYNVLEESKEIPKVLIRFMEKCDKTTNLACDAGTLAHTREKVERSKDPKKRGTKLTITLYQTNQYVYKTKLNVNGSQQEVKYLSKSMSIPWRITVDEENSIMKGVVYNVEEEFSKTPNVPATQIRSITRPVVKGVLVHEFGHVFGLAHENGSPSLSVMAPEINVLKEIHLWHWDKKCIRALYGDRRVRYEGLAVDELGFRKTVDYQLPKRSPTDFLKTPLVTSKASHLGLSRTVKDELEELFLLNSKKGVSPEKADEALVYSIKRNCEGNSCLSNYSYKVMKEWSLLDLYRLPLMFYFDVNPTFSMLSDSAQVGDAFLYHYSGDYSLVVKEEKKPKSEGNTPENGGSTQKSGEKKPSKVVKEPILAYDPPVIKVSYLDKSKTPAAREDKIIDGLYLERSGGFSTQKMIHSHVSVSTAYDHKSGNYIHAVVNTSREGTWKENKKGLWPKDEGGIALALYPTNYIFVDIWYMHDFLHDARQRVMERLPEHKYWKPQFKTQYGVAVACADHFTKYKYDNFNCFLAWIDRGLPRGHNVLYTWFLIRHDKTTDIYSIDWSNKIYVRDNFHAVGSLSAAVVRRGLVLVGKSIERAGNNGSSAVNQIYGITVLFYHRRSVSIPKKLSLGVKKSKHFLGRLFKYS